MNHIPARRTFYRGVLMRSRLEARFAGFLDGIDQPFLYEPWAYASGGQDYLGDFLLPHVFSPFSDPGDGWGFQSLVIEVKGPEPTPTELAAIQERMFLVRDSEPYAQLAITWESLMAEGRFLVCEAPRPQGFDLRAWEFGCWAECRCGTVSPVLIRSGTYRGRCPDCGSSVFVAERWMWLPGFGVQEALPSLVGIPHPSS